MSLRGNSPKLTIEDKMSAAFGQGTLLEEKNDPAATNAFQETVKLFKNKIDEHTFHESMLYALAMRRLADADLRQGKPEAAIDKINASIEELKILPTNELTLKQLISNQQFLVTIYKKLKYQNEADILQRDIITILTTIMEAKARSKAAIIDLPIVSVSSAAEVTQILGLRDTTLLGPAPALQDCGISTSIGTVVYTPSRAPAEDKQKVVEVLGDKTKTCLPANPQSASNAESKRATAQTQPLQSTAQPLIFAPLIDPMLKDIMERWGRGSMVYTPNPRKPASQQRNAKRSPLTQGSMNHSSQTPSCRK